MAEDIASQFPEMDQNEVKYAEFIKQRILKNGGSLKFLHISGQLSQLEHDVRVAVGAGTKELMSFLRKHEKLFAVNDGLVKLQKVPNNKDFPDYTRINGRSEIKSILPQTIHDVDGIVIKVHPTYGFITVKEPVKATVYFTPACFRDRTKTLLSELGILPGKKVKLNAKLGNTEFDSKYRATKVWIPEFVQNEVLHPKGFKPQVPKTRETGCYDANTSEGWGKIQKVFESFGFIMADGSSQNTVFFYKNQVCNVENVKDLTKILCPGDLVEYKAIRSQKKSEKARWEATKVWIRKNLNPKKQNLNKKTVKEDNKSSKEPKMMLNQKGKIYPHAKGTVVKFGENESQLADADSCVFFLHEVKVEDVGWEFSDGDAISFDGMKIKSAPGYKALLAWVGKKPNFVLPTDLGDFSGLSDEDVNNVSEDESCISKASELSGTNSDLSGKRRNNIYSSTSSLVSNSSRNSNQSRSRTNTTLRHLNNKSYSNNSLSPQHSELNKKRQNRSQSKKFGHGRNSKSSSENSLSYQQKKFHDIKSKASSKESLNSGSSDLSCHLKPNPNLYKSWGDTPYPDLDDDKQNDNNVDIDSEEDYYQDISIRRGKGSANFKSRKSSSYSEETIETCVISDNKSNSEEDFTDVLESNEYSVSNKNPEDSTFGIISRSDRFAELMLSEDDFSDALDDVNETSVLKEEDSEREDDDVSSACSGSECDEINSQKEPAYIKRFLGLNGKVKKVFCKYAEIENEMLKKPGTFFWKDLYHNGVPVSNKFDDLNEVLAPGQLVKFNCIEIVDNLGCCFLKVTVAWKGDKKPEITEMTSHEFISQNGLHVTAEEELVCSSLQGAAVKSMRHLNKKSDSEPQQKFLMVSSYIDDDGEEDIGDSYNEEISKDVPSEPEHSEEVINEDEASIGGEYTELRDRIFSQFETPIDVLTLTNIVSRLLESYKDSQMDSNVVASDLINIFLSNISAEKRHKSLSGDEVLHNGKEKLQTEENDVVPPEIQKTEMTSSYSQTIITGKIFSESIFTL
ncbi:uncharacterized protein TNCT_712781 [Trichonephila clavata]|uniref:Egal-1 winged helix domain-containing protein n=1 Tax=Trichonephila clavata TaxID=2740835 RepID=A0A8X6EX13_TRICU|nr:uncharacterized protein TNCT_712781 [Trichonephila clavata]